MSKKLYTRNSKSNHDDIWDDSLLIKAYEESIRLEKEEVAKKLAMKTNSIRKNSKSSESEESSSSNAEEFKVGDFVRSTYEDGVDYEAEILSISENGTAFIKYIGYGNEERVKVEDLVASWGLKAREEQKLLAEADNPSNLNEEDQEELHKFVNNQARVINEKLPTPPMPPMPPLLADNTKESEYMSAMLMSWYMSGYYTGLYHGRKEAVSVVPNTPPRNDKQQQQQRKKQRKNNKL